VAAGRKTTQQAAHDAAKDIKEYADLRLANKTEGSMPWYSASPKTTRETVESQRKGYAKRGELKTFVDDMIVNHGLSRARASYLAYPIKENKELNNFLSEQDKTFKAADPTGIRSTLKAQEIAKKMPALKENDSLLSIAAELDGKNINPNAFLAEVQKQFDEGKIALNNRQIEELQESRNFNVSTGDWWLLEMGKFGSLPRIE
jgi:hypothetical protein